MLDLRNHKDLIHGLVAEANENDTNWKWSVKSISKTEARIFWGYLEYCDQPEPCFSINLEEFVGDWMLTAKDEHGDTLTGVIVEDKDIPEFNTPLDTAIREAIGRLVRLAHYLY